MTNLLPAGPSTAFRGFFPTCIREDRVTEWFVHVINQSGCLKISLRHAVFANSFYLRHLCRACSLLLTLGLLQSCAHTCLPPLGPRKKHGFISFILFFQVQSSNNYACFKFQSPTLSDLRPSLAQMRTRGVTRVGTFTECVRNFSFGLHWSQFYKQELHRVLAATAGAACSGILSHPSISQADIFG